jgi:3-keto-disaccharide hydrolase
VKILIMLIVATALGAACTQEATRLPESRSLIGSDAREIWRGWESNDFPAGWRVDGDTLSKDGDAEDLISCETFGDFELELEWKLSEGGNAGIFYRGTREYDHIYWSAPEYQLLDDVRHPDGRNRLTSAAAAYALYAAPAGIVKPAGEWNAARIVVDGAHVEHWLNGQKVVTYELWSPDWKAKVAACKFTRYPNYGLATEGLIGIQGDHAGMLTLRGIRIRALR